MTLAQTYRDIKRLNSIANVLFTKELGFFVHKLRLKKHVSLDKRLTKGKVDKPPESLPKRLRESMEELGGAYVKLGQLLSLRPDLIPPEYVEEFTKLQDSVKPIPYSSVKKVVEEEFGRPISSLFSHFNQKPLAAASVGQVHEAVLKKGGKKVAVKVQRPRIAKLFETDIDLLYHLASLVEKHMPEIKKFHPNTIVAEFEKYTLRELDYTKEAANIERYRAGAKDYPDIKVPEVFWDYTTKRVLTMEFIDGIKLSRVKDVSKLGVSPKKINGAFTKLFIEQVLYHGFFHADPHPGNLLITKDKKLALLDFGIAGSLAKEDIMKLGSFWQGIILRDVEKIIQGMLNFGFVKEDVDMGGLEGDLITEMGRFYGKELEDLDASAVMNVILGLARDYNIQFPADFVLLFKAMMTSEGFLRKVDPSYNFVEASEPILEKYLENKIKPKELYKNIKTAMLDYGSLILSFPKEARKVLKAAEKQKIEELIIDDHDMEKFSDEIERSTNRLTIGIILGAIIVASSLITLAKVPPLFYDVPLIAWVGYALSLGLLIYLILSLKGGGD